MPIEEISSVASFLSSQKSTTNQGGGAFAAAMRLASDEAAGTADFTGVKSSPIAAGQDLLGPKLWLARYDVGIKARAEGIASDADTLKAEFVTVLEKAADEGGFSDPKAFLKSLTADEREILQITQGLADPITEREIDGLSDEGALNLLLPPGAQRDWNGDAIYTVGRANGFRFPTDGTPADVKSAWEEATAGLSEKDLMLAEGLMMANLISANSKQDAAGNVMTVNLVAENILGLNQQALTQHTMQSIWGGKLYRSDQELITEEQHPVFMALHSHMPSSCVAYMYNNGNFQSILITSIPVLDPETNMPIKVFSTLLDVVALQKTDNIAQTQLHQLEAIERISRISLQAGTFKETLHSSLEALLDIFDCDRAALIYPCDPNAGELTIPMECYQAWMAGRI